MRSSSGRNGGFPTTDDTESAENDGKNYEEARKAGEE